MDNPRTPARPIWTARAAYVGRIAAHGFALGVVFHLASAVGVMHPVNTTAGAIETESVSAMRPVEVSVTEKLMERHGCWSDDAPAEMVGVLPGHVVTDRGYGGSRMVGIALEQVFDDVDHGLTIAGFCR